MLGAQQSDTQAKLYQCSTCGKSYNRSSHLRRHEVTHSNEKSSRCPYCNRSFAKVEVARRHAKACAEKFNAPPPPAAKRGRKVRACDRCSQGKLSCDALIPSCSRCAAQNKPCTYDRRHLLSGEASAARPVCKAPFLLSFTDSSRETTVDAFVQDASYTTSEEVTHCHHTTRAAAPRPPTAPTSSSLYTTSIWDTIADFQYHQPPIPTIGNIEDHLNSDHGLYAGLGLDDDPTTSANMTVLAARMDGIRQHLQATHNHAVLNNPTTTSSPIFFEPALAQTVFTAANAKHFLWSYFHRCHLELPILHRPSFRVDDVASSSTPLLLAVVVAGAVFCTPTDAALAARRFVGVAEEFVYGQGLFARDDGLDGVGGGWDAVRDEEDIQTLQAALIVNMMQSGMSDAAAKRRLKARRHPLFVAKLREKGLLASRRRRLGRQHERGAEGPGTWQGFIADEMRVRLATYAFMADNHLCLFFAHPPQLHLSEMLCDLPCAEDVWDAKDAAEFERLYAQQAPSSSSSTSSPLPSPMSVVNALLTSGDPTTSVPPSQHWRQFDLYVAISALQSLTHTTRISPLGDATFSAYTSILHATDRWEKLWRSCRSNDVDAVSSSSSSSERNTFIRHADEVCWLVRTVVEVAQRQAQQQGGGGSSEEEGGGGGEAGGGDGDEYMRRVSVDSFAELHAFIQKYAYA